MGKTIASSELVLNASGSVYHLDLKEENIADKVILVGDPGRVSKISSKFSRIEFKTQNREFITHTGYFNNERITVLATGIGTDNIDICLNELDAAVNIDLTKKEIKSTKRKLQLIRIGTSGALQENIPVDSFLVSEYGVGFDNLLHFYENGNSINEHKIVNELNNQLNWPSQLNEPYVVKGDDNLVNKIAENCLVGMTATASGFYGPQGRELRLPLKINDLNERLTRFEFEEKKITNFEMETSALYALSKMLGHEACTVCLIVANRIRKEFSSNYAKKMDALIENVLQKLSS